MSKKTNNTNFIFAAIDFVWTTIAFIYFISKPYVVIAGIFYLVPAILKSFKHWVQKDQPYLYYVYSVVETITATILLIFEISVMFGLSTNPIWFPQLFLLNVIYSMGAVTEHYEPYKKHSKGGKQR